jgi:hypothetical protein
MVWGASSASETLLAAVAATGAGTPINMVGYTYLGINISGTFVGTVQFEASVDNGATYFVVGMKTMADGAAVTTTTAVGAFKLPIDAACDHFRCNVTAYTSGTITAKSYKQADAAG